MCRAKSCGGRRCPYDNPVKRSAERKTRKARQTAEGVSRPAQDVRIDAPAPFNRDAAMQLAATIQDAYGPEADPATQEARERLEREHGSRIQAVIALGNMVRDEGERRAGVDLGEARALLENEGGQIRDAQAALENVIIESRKKLIATVDAVKGSFEKRAQVLTQSKEQMAQEISPAMARLDELRVRDEQLAQQLKTIRTDLADGYRSALADVRELGGQDLTFVSRTSKAAREAFNEAARVYPTEWLERSNAGEAMFASVTKQRAHYSRGTQKLVSRTTVPVVDHIQARTHDVEAYCAENSTPDLEYAPDPDNKSTTPGVENITVTHYETKMMYVDLQGKPKGRGWVKHSGKQGLYTLWRRPKTTTGQAHYEVTPEIRANKTDQLVNGHSETYATTTHELAHRMEHAVPQIVSMEQDFLTYRTSTADGVEQPKQIYPGARGEVGKEMGYEDNFVVHYSGKTYGEDVHHYELMSTGVEALFAGRHGAQAGLGRQAGQYTHDDEYRSFVLGVMASAK